MGGFNMSKEYIAKGFVLGKIWGGGFGAYPSRELKAKTMNGLLREASKELKSGGLDSGMGFEYLKGAFLDIEIIETINIKGRNFRNSEYTSEIIGKLTNKEADLLEDCVMNQ
jgi:hypothetical protein